MVFSFHCPRYLQFYCLFLFLPFFCGGRGVGLKGGQRRHYAGLGPSAFLPAGADDKTPAAPAPTTPPAPPAPPGPPAPSAPPAL